MTTPALCSIWWLLAAVLLGWLLCGWFARPYLYRAASGPDADDVAGLKRRIAELEARLAQAAAAAPAASARAMPAAAPVVEAAVAAPPPPAVDFAAARAAGFAVRGPDDLEIIEGIGPKIAAILHAAGVATFADLAAMTPAQIQPLLDAAGPNFRIANPQTWPDQSALAAANRWAELKNMQDNLTAGRKA
jgi:predicted flap endonuclease-1-like 5' DNA nuclease